jgi:hypothetical protein
MTVRETVRGRFGTRKILAGHKERDTRSEGEARSGTRSILEKYYVANRRFPADTER